MRKWDGIIVHHSASPDGVTRDFDALRNYHMSWRYEGRVVTEAEGRRLQSEGAKVIPPWTDIGYHFVVERVGDEYVVIPGRNLDQNGAHCLGRNRTHLGVCLVGNFEEEEPPLEQLDVAARKCARLSLAHGFGANKVLGHREVYNTRCPGFYTNMGAFRALVGMKLPAMELDQMFQGEDDES